MDILSEILTTKRVEVAAAKLRVPPDVIESRARKAPPTRDFAEAILKSPPPALIAEVKKASPSKGVIREDFDPVIIARAYAEGDADCLSILTDEQYFQGSLGYLHLIRDAVQLPLLRKDFIIDEYQIFQSRVAGADAILLIAAALDTDQIESLAATAESLGMAALVEVHNAEELARVLTTRARLIGINNRDLHTFKTTLDTTLELLPAIPPGKIVVSESGINTRADVLRLRDAGAHAILVGESLMREPDIGSKMRDLLED